jgi:hypothetical protein
MRVRLLYSLLGWVIAVAFVGGLLALAYVFHGRYRSGPEAGGENAQEAKRAVNGVVKLGAELAESLGLKEDVAQEVEWQQRIPAYGRVVPNPRAIAEIRAPFAGTLRSAPGRDWPALGSRLQAGNVLGWLDIRVGPQERLDLEIKLREARVKLQGAEEVFKIQQERVQRFQTLETPGVVSRADLDPALVQLADARTQMATAKAAVQQWEEALAEINRQGERENTTWSQPLKAPAPGEIIDLAGRPGMALEAGGLVARVVDFRRALVRLDLPARVLAGGPPSEVELLDRGDASFAFEGATNRPETSPLARSVRAKLVGAAPQVETSQFAGYWYEADTTPASEKGSLSAGGAIWRPGLFVKALLKVPQSSPQHAVAVPETALLFHQGRVLVYVGIAPGRFEQREVQILGREAGRVVLASGVTPGERVVSRRAQVLLSEAFRSAADND